MVEIHTYNPDEIFAERDAARRHFLALHGWKQVGIHNLKEDGSFRRYYRVLGKEGGAVLMDSVPELEAIWASSHKLSDFVAIAPKLIKAGISAPEIYAVDLQNGFCLMEDLGSESYNKTLQQEGHEQDLYSLAADVLIRFRDDAGLNKLPLGSFFNTGLYKRRDQICTWYYPGLKQEPVPTSLMSAYTQAWEKIDAALPAIKNTFQHGDYHVDNLTYLSQREGIRKCGVFDFQGAVMGPMPYDLVNLLEDARTTLPDWLKLEIRKKYVSGISAQDKEAFEAWYIALAAMFHCRVIGYFMQVYIRDNKSQYQEHIPRLRGYIRKALEHNLMAPLKEWFVDADLDLQQPLPAFNRKDIMSLIREPKE